MKKILTVVFLGIYLLPIASYTQSASNETLINLKVDGSRKYQQIDGIGVNANTRSWNDGELKPAINMLLDSMHATIWRVIVETVEKWEDVNDNDDPFTFNWEYYNKLYETPKFRKVWDMIGYLNEHGVTDNLMINFMGFAPQWMGMKVIEPKYEDEYVEMLVSFFYYAINTRHLKFGLIAPTNESDWYNYREGPHLTGIQQARIYRKLVDRMESLGIMGKIKIVGPDVVVFENATKSFIPAIMKDSLVWSKIAHLSFHSYGGYQSDIQEFIKESPYPNTTFWLSEWNAWCNGCDDGKLGEYNYDFAAKSMSYLLEFLKNGATACLAFEAYDSYYEHHAPSPFSYWGMLGYDSISRTYFPRKNFYSLQQVSRFVLPGSWRVFTSQDADSIPILAFYDSATSMLSIIGINKMSKPITLNGSFENLPFISRLELTHTDSAVNLHRDGNVQMAGKTFSAKIPAKSIFTLMGDGNLQTMNPEPANWYAGDIHVHLDCNGDKPLDENELARMMEPNNLAVISLLADMGTGELNDSKRDLPKVNGKDAPLSHPGRIIHWDTEWKGDSVMNFDHMALGGHLALLGLKSAKKMWKETPYNVLKWGKDQNAVVGFVHMEYLNDSIQNKLNCCIPVDYPVEVALGMTDFISEDVFGNKSFNDNNTYNSESTIHAYYKLLNCGFKLGLAAGTDYPCNYYESLGSLLTYVNTGNKLTYRRWIDGIKYGRTVVSRNGHKEFIDLKVNEKYGPGDEIKMENRGKVGIVVKWTAVKELTGKIELVVNGKIVQTQGGTAKPGVPLILRAKIEFKKSSWICARRMEGTEHLLHTAPVYISVNNKPVRASAPDAQFFVSWIDNILENIKPGHRWNRYFSNDLPVVQQQYVRARDRYQKIAYEAKTLEASYINSFLMLPLEK